MSLKVEKALFLGLDAIKLKYGLNNNQLQSQRKKNASAFTARNSRAPSGNPFNYAVKLNKFA